ncbi:uncharacterized protein LOC128214142 [Mya arenaria]|uniref:uncharacterized protein LOC128214142 n=1 Tax=Mya arenaria TaxID=6604 RepID=UPI0022E84679|nr:uncharacterized protein LOC128214142 [Mya arenaria]XP_052776390.1 uncharacterized protein LOC128214142 [Mya arenaria]XP_052776391.1 uncharacterized protein LOC128214142 [Mya arenaria]XP_052776392.1 uncharacterized protein LOC128214142 [Mya arenaria]
MLAESPPGGHESPPFFQSEGARSKRLSDVKRGAEYYKKLDHIAEAQWKSNTPKFPPVPRKLSVLPKITTSVLSEPGTRHSRSTFNMTSTPRQSISVMSGMESTVTGFTGYTGTSMSLPSHISRIVQHRSSDQYQSPLAPIPDEEDRNYNPWGTSHSPLEDQTKLTPDDLKPRELPFKYRDSRKLVTKPTPKKSMPMSRVAANERVRHQRTVTNFRSRNGTIRVIRPLDPLPELEKYQKTYTPEMFDIENIEREKTFMMLERIDKILHPNKKPPQSPIGSSEEEIPAMSTSSVTLSDDVNELRDIFVNVPVQDFIRRHTKSPPAGSPLTPRLEHSSLSRGSKGRKSRNDRPKRPRIKFIEDPFKIHQPKTFSDVLHELETSLEDVDTKCQSWVDKCV